MEKRRWERPRTGMTGVPRLTRVRAVGGVIEEPASSSKHSQSPSAATAFPPAARSPSPGTASSLRSTARRAGTWWLKPCRSSICAMADKVMLLWERRPISVLIRASVQVWSCRLCATGPLASFCSSTSSAIAPSPRPAEIHWASLEWPQALARDLYGETTDAKVTLLLNCDSRELDARAGTQLASSMSGAATWTATRTALRSGSRSRSDRKPSVPHITHECRKQDPELPGREKLTLTRPVVTGIAVGQRTACGRGWMLDWPLVITP